jgi:hypothetical protein
VEDSKLPFDHGVLNHAIFCVVSSLIHIIKKLFEIPIHGHPNLSFQTILLFCKCEWSLEVITHEIFFHLDVVVSNGFKDLLYPTTMNSCLLLIWMLLLPSFPIKLKSLALDVTSGIWQCLDFNLSFFPF